MSGMCPGCLHVRILKSDKARDVSGTATAAALWGTGAIGLAVAWSRFEIALLLSVLTFCTLQFIYPIKQRLRGDEDRRG